LIQIKAKSLEPAKYLRGATLSDLVAAKLP